jgi:hypothetical protein
MNIKLASGLLAAALLAGCGGGDDDAPADKYIGIWQGCIVEGANSYRETLLITKTSDVRLRVEVSQAHFPGSTTCAGTPAGTVSGIAAFDVQGTKTVQGQTVDKVINSQGGGSRKDIFLVSATMLRYSAENGPVDAEGYPETLDPQFLARVQ